jgi:sulfite reductase (NADPH) flavoprotein alpha-component
MKTASRIDRPLIGQWLVGLALALLAGWLLRLQVQPWPTVTPLAQPRVFAGFALAAYAAFCGLIAWRARTPRVIASMDGEASWRVIYASQTGFALELAERTAQALRDAGQPACVHDINAIDLQVLDGAHCLFIASTTGEGDPPDHAMGFVKRVMTQPADLSRTRYAVLALGDSEYAQFCAFGRELDEWLHRRGAQPMFDRVDVDNADPAALRHWQHRVGVLSGHADQPDWTTPRHDRWTLAARHLLNPGSLGGEAWHIELQPPAGVALDWQAGDIAEIGPRNAADDVAAFLARHALDGCHIVKHDRDDTPLSEILSRSRLPAMTDAVCNDTRALVASLQALPHREYSIASLPADGSLHLLVRLMQREDGTPGIGSGWLCRHAAIGDGIDLRIRSNPNFHAPLASQPMILIGNGTGLAGLRAHLKARAAAGATPQLAAVRRAQCQRRPPARRRSRRVATRGRTGAARPGVLSRRPCAALRTGCIAREWRRVAHLGRPGRRRLRLRQPGRHGPGRGCGAQRDPRAITHDGACRRRALSPRRLLMRRSNRRAVQ